MENKPISTGKLFEVYPNPASEQITINSLLPETDKLQIELWNISGKCDLKGNISGQNTIIPINSYAKGIYLLKIKSDNGMETKKIILE